MSSAKQPPFRHPLGDVERWFFGFWALVFLSWFEWRGLWFSNESNFNCFAGVNYKYMGK